MEVPPPTRTPFPAEVTKRLGALALGLVVFYLGIMGYFLRFPFEGRCWFFAPEWSELSPSEMITNLAWLGAGWAAFRLSRTYRGFLPVVFFCGFMFLEESNWGRAFWGAFTDGEEGKALHNLVEDRFRERYWSWESGVQIATFILVYWGFATWIGYQTRNWIWTLIAGCPALVWTVFLILQWRWTSESGFAMYPNHPCVSIDEEIYESLFALSSWGMLGMERLRRLYSANRP